LRMAFSFSFRPSGGEQKSPPSLPVKGRAGPPPLAALPPSFDPEGAVRTFSKGIGVPTRYLAPELRRNSKLSSLTMPRSSTHTRFAWPYWASITRW
jgi:hypothetical protein